MSVRYPSRVMRSRLMDSVRYRARCRPDATPQVEHTVDALVQVRERCVKLSQLHRMQQMLLHGLS